jgi:PAS domain S-box-containing protein
MPETERALLLWAFEHSSDGMLITDLTGKIRMVNGAFIRMFGYSNEEVTGQRTTFLRSKYSTPEFYQTMWSSLAQFGEWKGEIVNRTKSGEDKTCFLTITSVISAQGERIGYLGVEIDLTERKMLENQVIQGEKLSAIGESIATLAHEIRNPLNGIAMNIYMLERAARSSPSWSDEERESIQLIGRESKRLTALVKEVLDFARPAPLKLERVVLAAFFDELKELLGRQATESGVDLEWVLSNVTLTGLFDANHIKQVMINLLQNAIEASQSSPEHKVRIRASAKSAPQWKIISPSATILHLEVENTGVTPDPKVAANFFKPFFTTKALGHGLGLATCAKIVKQHHGIIDLQRAEPPYSTSFFVALPA